MSSGYLLIDGSNFGYAASATTRLTVGGQEVQGIFGVLRMLRPLLATWHMLTPIVLWDGHSWRYKAFPEYKSKRSVAPTTTHEREVAAQRESFKVQRPLIRQSLELLGIRQMMAINLEADDLAGILCRRFLAGGKKVVLASGDKDWIQLIRPGVAWIDQINQQSLTAESLPKKLGWRPSREVVDPKTSKMKKQPGKLGIFKDGATIEGFVGVPSPQAWLEMKALMGDTSDDIPGVGDIGEKGALEMVVEYGTVGGFINQSIDGTIKKMPKKFADFADKPERQELFRRNMDLMDLNSDKIPTPINLTLERRDIDLPQFEAFCSNLAFKSILTDLPGWVAPFQRIAA